MKQTATTATVEMCPEQEMGSGFQLLVGLAEIHVPRMWVEENDKGHHVRKREGGRERERERERKRETEKEREMHTETETHTQIESQRESGKGK